MEVIVAFRRTDGAFGMPIATDEIIRGIRGHRWHWWCILGNPFPIFLMGKIRGLKDPTLPRADDTREKQC